MLFLCTYASKEIIELFEKRGRRKFNEVSVFYIPTVTEKYRPLKMCLF